MIERFRFRPRPLAGWSLSVLWAVTLFVLSSEPNLPGAIGLVSPWDKVVHAAAFGLLGFLVSLATGRPLVAVMIASLYGVSDELHQAFVPGRSSDPLDWLADTLGAVLVVAAVGFLTRRRRSGRQPVE
ncbi:MAG TPA: VanZ family protein [Trueperaceae bacterium]